jgi:Tfp pilus assembly protein PilV
MLLQGNRYAVRPSMSAPLPRSCPEVTRPARRRSRGFTIIEVAMATFVMAFGISTSIIAMQAGFKQIDLARGTTIASQIVQSEMERLRMMSWTMISALPASESFDGSTYFSANADIAGRYTITRTVAANSTEPADIKDLTVSVRWQGYDGRWHQRAFTAIYARNGLYDFFYTIAHP